MIHISILNVISIRMYLLFYVVSSCFKLICLNHQSLESLSQFFVHDMKDLEHNERIFIKLKLLHRRSCLVSISV